jgi:hypothetical protein
MLRRSVARAAATDSTIPERRADAVSRRTGESVLVLDVASGEYYSLDDVAARIWELSDGARSVGEIVTELASEFDVSRDMLTRDVCEFLDDLAAAELVTFRLPRS